MSFLHDAVCSCDCTYFEIYVGRMCIEERGTKITFLHYTHKQIFKLKILGKI